MLLRPPRSPLFPYTTLFRSDVSYDGSVAQLYMDGQVMGGGALSVNTVVPGTGLQLGAGVGDYDEFAAYAAALSPDRIAAHWTAGNTSNRSEERRVGKEWSSRGSLEQ